MSYKKIGRQVWLHVSTKVFRRVRRQVGRHADTQAQQTVVAFSVSEGDKVTQLSSTPFDTCRSQSRSILDVTIAANEGLVIAFWMKDDYG